ncbi:MAG: JAB domain-containing protein [Erythrobacter sp.]
MLAQLHANPLSDMPGVLGEATCETHRERLVRHLRQALIRSGEACERGHVLFTDGAWRYLGDRALGAGGQASLVLRPREILMAGFALGARGMILAHNHPSGECRPSQADLDATERLRWLGGMVDLALLDHLIVTHSAVYSMRAGGLL